MQSCKQDEIQREAALELLKKNPVFWSRLGFGYDPPLKNNSGRPLVFTENLSKYGKYHRSFQSIGVNIHTCIVHLGWMGVDEYDYSLTDRVLEEIFQQNSDIYFIPRVKLNVPVDWCYENPEEVFVYPNGPQTAEEIRAMVGTLQQDYIGYDAPQGYYMAGDYVDTRPNVGGLIARQSFSSQKWLHDAGIAFEKFIDHLESGKYGDRILGYHIAYGTSGECVLWGRISGRYGDYGIGHKQKFYQWGLEKYGSQQELSQAWNQTNITPENLQLPTPEARYNQNSSIKDYFRDNENGVIVTDFDEFSSKINADAIEYFARIVRRKAPTKLTGAFYGYFIHIDNSAYTGYLALERLLNSPHIDFFAAPKSYYRCRAGEPGGVLCAAQSVNRRKLWLDELDNRTHLAKNVPEKYLSANFEETKTVFWREYAKNLADSSGFWWMDLGGDWFDSPDIMETFSQITQVNKFLQAEVHHSEADILVILDEQCLVHMNICPELRLGFMEDFLCELHNTGCITDVYRLSDLEFLDLSQYKLIIFAHTFEIADHQRKYINNISADKVLLFNYAAGIISETSVSLDNCRKLTGIALEEYWDDRFAFPQLRAEVSKTIRPNGGVNMVNTQPFLQAADLRAITDHIGCHAYAPCGCTVYGDCRFVGIFPSEDIDTEIVMRKKGTYQNILTGEVYTNVERIPLKLKAKEAAFYIKQPKDV